MNLLEKLLQPITTADKDFAKYLLDAVRAKQGAYEGIFKATPIPMSGYNTKKPVR